MKAKFYIEYYTNGKLVDISEVGFNSENEAQKVINENIFQDNEVNEKIISEFTEDSINDLFDNTLNDRIIFAPKLPKYSYKIAKYKKNEYGYFNA